MYKSTKFILKKVYLNKETILKIISFIINVGVMVTSAIV